MTPPNDGKDVKKADHLHIAGVNVKQYSHPEKWFGNIFKKLNVQLP